jgi:hypothetical protein
MSNVIILAIAAVYAVIGAGFTFSFYRRLGETERHRTWHATFGGVMWPVFGLALFGYWLGEGPKT